VNFDVLKENKEHLPKSLRKKKLSNLVFHVESFVGPVKKGADMLR